MPGLTVSVLGGVVQDLTTISDRLPDDGETVTANAFTMQPGGKGSNSAVAIHRLSRRNPSSTKDQPFDQETVDEGLQVRMVGAVGGDEFGPALKENLVKCGVNVDGVRIMEGQKTAVANILVEADSGANRIMQYPGAAYALEPADFMTLESLGGGVAPDFIVAQLEIRREAIEQAIETASREKVEVLLNPSPARYLLPEIYPMIGHLVMNETEAMMLSDCDDNGKEDTKKEETADEWTNIANYFHELGVKNVVITLAEKGAFYSNENGAGYVEAEKNCTVFDTSGAGDSFVGGYTAKYLTQKQKGQWDIKEAVQYGCKAAARVIEYLGCLDPIVWADEVDLPRYPKDVENTPETVKDPGKGGIQPV